VLANAGNVMQELNDVVKEVTEDGITENAITLAFCN
jgi:hypothetical protein